MALHFRIESAKVNADWPGWVARCLQGVAHLLVPSARVAEVTLQNGGHILFIAIGRSTTSSLVPAIIKGKWLYYQRLADGNYLIPESLLADVQTGRRARPAFNLKPWTGGHAVTINNNHGGPLTEAGGVIDLRISFDMENIGLVTAREVEVGTLLWRCPVAHRGVDYASESPNAFKPYVETPRPQGIGEAQGWFVGRSARSNDPPKEVIDVRPFGQNRILAGPEFPVVMQPDRIYHGRAAVYILADGHPPEWFQLDFCLSCKGGRPQVYGATNISPTHGGRPVVSWRVEEPQPTEVGRLLA